MLVLLPPSETKRTGGDGPPLAAATLAFPELDPLRKELVDELVVLAADVPASRAALGLSPRQDGEIGRNAELWTSATAPAPPGSRRPVTPGALGLRRRQQDEHDDDGSAGRLSGSSRRRPARPAAP